ncbi:LysR family transcriptional regulator [Pseudomonas batumici]|uniref:LysR family transcriptional regulator n=1 Tax=Pseudomonas batumici TaxID=226910 RepID=UPI0030D587B3
MDKLLALTMFVETVRCGGYSAAARKLGVSTSSVTRQVASLEAQLGASLLNRTTRNTNPTVAGQAYFEKALSILDALAEADTAVADRSTEARGRLRVSVPVEFGRRVVAPHLGRLLSQYPELDVSLSLSDQMADLLKERIDLSVRLGSSLASDDIISKPIGRFERWVVGSPDYFARAGIPLQPQELLNHECLCFDYGDMHHGWAFRGSEDCIRINVQGRFESNNADILREAALNGRGTALLADWLVAEDVRQGHLTRVLANYEANPGDANGIINALYLPNHRGSSRVKVFISFLEEILSY